MYFNFYYIVYSFYRNLRPIPVTEGEKESPKTEFELIFAEIKRKL